jgi:hypothetical protein
VYLAKCQPLHAFLYFMVSLCFCRTVQNCTLLISSDKARFEVFAAVLLTSDIFWDVMLCHWFSDS